MSVIESPNDPLVQAEVDRTFLASRFSVRPLEFRTKELAGGHYRTQFTTGLTTTLNAADAIASLRWTDPTRYFILQRLRAFAVVTTAFGTAQEVSLDLVKLSNFSAADTGGNAVTPLGTACRKTPLAGASQIADLRVADATALGAGTAVAEGKALSKAVFAIGNAVGSAAAEQLLDALAGGEHPLVLGNLEGFRIRIAFTQGATGVVRFTFVMDWAEVPVAAF